MKKLFAILAVMGVLSFGMTQTAMAQDSTATAAPAQTEQVAAADEAAAPAVVEEGGLHKELKTKFIEGDAGFMSLVAIALVLGLAFCIERIIYLSLAEVDVKKLMAKIEAALEKYLPKMIELAGGKYIFDKLGDEDDVASTMSMQMEEFYAGAKDADYIIYNSTIDGSMQTLSDLTGKSPMLEKFKAVQDGNVYCTTKNLYQSTMELGTITSDIHKMLIGDDADLTYLYKLE